MDKEIWKEIKGWEDTYEVSNYGRVKSIRTGKILSISLNSCGYAQLVLCYKNTKTVWRVHRLVAITFIPNPEKKAEINHIDGNKTNNHISNLEWCTRSENNNHALRTGLKINKGGITASVGQYKNGELINSYNSLTEASKNGFVKSSISNCINNRNKSHHGFEWKRLEKGEPEITFSKKAILFFAQWLINNKNTENVSPAESKSKAKEWVEEFCLNILNGAQQRR